MGSTARRAAPQKAPVERAWRGSRCLLSSVTISTASARPIWRPAKAIPARIPGFERADDRFAISAGQADRWHESNSSITLSRARWWSSYESIAAKQSAETLVDHDLAIGGRHLHDMLNANLVNEEALGEEG